MLTTHQDVLRGARRPRRPTLPQPADRQRFRRRLLAWYRRNGRDLPWRQTTRPVPHPRVGGDAAADAGRSRAAEVRRVAGRSTRRSRRSPPRTKRTCRETWRPLGYNIRPRRLHAIARESVARYGGELPSDEATLLSFKGIGEYTAGAMRASRSASAPPSSTPTSRACCSACSSAAAMPKAHAMKQHLWSVSRTVLPHGTSSTSTRR